MSKQPSAVLAGDIGGTKTRLAIFSSESSQGKAAAEATFSSRTYPNLETIVREFLSQVKTKVNCASFGVAGPVINGQAKITNLPWIIDEKRLTDTLGFSRVYLMNDLMAAALAIPLLEREEIFTLNRGNTVSGGTIAVIAPGTGLGHAYLTWDGSKYRPYPSEGGHADFAPTNPAETRLLLYLMDRFGHVSTEHICSGIGLKNLYEFLKENEHGEEPLWLAEQLSNAQDPVPFIVGAALDDKKPCRLCQTTLEQFISILGAEAGNMALRMMATGGVYLGGGIPPRIVPVLKKGLFMKAFRSKGRMSDLMDAFPVHVILSHRIGLMGAAAQGFRL